MNKKQDPYIYADTDCVIIESSLTVISFVYTAELNSLEVKGKVKIKIATATPLTEDLIKVTGVKYLELRGIKNPLIEKLKHEFLEKVFLI